LRPVFRPALWSAALAVLAVSAASVILPPSEDFQPSNPYWNGLEAFFKAVNATPVDLAHERVVPENSVLFVIGPSTNVTEEYVEALREYLLEGGSLILMDETGAVNPILSGLGLKVDVDGHQMFDAVFYYRGWRMPKITSMADRPLTQGLENIVLNLPSTLDIKDPTLMALAYSSSFSFLDLDGNSQPSAEEPKGPFPVAAETTYGKGRLIIFSDSSIFLNGIISLGDNLKLLHNIAMGKAVFVDVGVWQPTPQLAYRDGVLGAYRVFSAPEFKYSLAFATLALIYMLLHRKRAVTDVDEVGEVVSRHPGWDRRLLEALEEARNRFVQRS